PALSGTEFDLDFNPVTDTARVLSNTGQNLRLDPATGIATAETNLAFAAGDPNSGLAADIAAAAYDNNIPRSPSATLYAIDRTQGLLVSVGSKSGTPGSPSAGQLFTIGGLGQTPSGNVALDIGSLGTACAAFNSNFYVIDLNSGSANLIGAIGTAATIR